VSAVEAVTCTAALVKDESLSARHLELVNGRFRIAKCVFYHPLSWEKPQDVILIERRQKDGLLSGKTPLFL